MKTLKKIHLKGVSETLSEKELKNVLGGKRGTVCRCTFDAIYCLSGSPYHVSGGLFGGGDNDDCSDILKAWQAFNENLEPICEVPDGNEYCTQIDY